MGDLWTNQDSAEIGEDTVQWTAQSSYPWADAWFYDSNTDDITVPVPNFSGDVQTNWFERYPESEWQAGDERCLAILWFDSDGNRAEGSNGHCISLFGPTAGPSPPQEQPPAEQPPSSGPPSPGQPPPATGIPGVDTVLAFLNTELTSLLNQVQGIAQRILGDIGDRLATLLPGTLDVMATQTQALSEFISAFSNNQIKAPDFWGLLWGTLRPIWENTDQAHAVFIRDYLMTLAVDWYNGPTSDRADDIGGALQDIWSLRGPDVNISDILHAVARTNGPMGFILMILACIPGIFSLANAVLAPEVSDITQAQFAQRPVTPISPADAANMVVQNVLDRDSAANNALRSGINGDDFDLLTLLAGEPPGAASLFDLANRGVISDDDVTRGLLQSRLKPEWTDALKALRFQQASPSDLVRFLVREVFDENKRSALDLDAEYPDSATPEFNKLGIDETLARNYWASHWDLPSATQGFEMRHRGIIDDGTLGELLAALDYAPVWRDRLTAITYNVFTRVDIRRMHRTGVLTDDDLIPAYTNLGYTTEDATRLQQFTIALNNQENRANKFDVTAGVRQHILGAVQQGVLSEADATQHFQDLGYDDQHIQAFLSEARLAEMVRRADRIRDATKRLYVSGDWTEDQARSTLQAWGFTPEEIDYLLADWFIDFTFKELSDEHKHQKDLTKAEIEEAYLDQIFSEDDAHSSLVALGFDDSEASTLLALVDHRRAKADVAAQVAAIRTEYTTRRIERGDASSQLDQLGINATRRDALLRSWTRDLRQQQARLPLASLEHLVANAIYTDDQAAEELRLQHFSEAQISALLTLWSETADEASQRRKEREEAKRRHLNVAQIQRSLVTGLIERNEAIDRLLDLHYSRTDAHLLTELGPRELSAQQILAALKGHVIEPASAEHRLTSIGYTRDDARLLLETALGAASAVSGNSSA